MARIKSIVETKMISNSNSDEIMVVVAYVCALALMSFCYS